MRKNKHKSRKKKKNKTRNPYALSSRMRSSAGKHKDKRSKRSDEIKGDRRYRENEDY